jgi:phenylalanyl-tRNA synthetase beta chain
MKVSLDWISDYTTLPPGLELKQVAHDLTMSTVEVEAVTRLGESLDSVKVGLIKSMEAIPGSASLKLLRCDVGLSDSMQIVCGAPNVRENMLVPIALPGARIKPRGKEPLQVIQPAEVAGFMSNAVVCSASELELEDLFPDQRDGIIDLSELNSVPGADLSTAIGWTDVIFEIDNKSLTHRPDLWGHYGLARELASIYGSEIKPLRRYDNPIPAQKLVGEIDVACNRFTATAISGVETAKAPFWIRSRLVKIGQRPINLLVDLTNYVMFAVGQPTHVYDAAHIKTPIGVRRAHPSEKLALLNDQTYSLDPSMLVVADENGAVALAGVMGGADSVVSSGTREIILEAANFDPVTTRRTSTNLSLRSEASARFEKAVDTQRIDDAVGLFLALLLDAQPHAKITGFDDAHPRPTQPKAITISVKSIQDRLGKPLSAEEMRKLLVRIGFDVVINDDTLQIVVPTWRSTGDVSIPQDIVEEVARLYGYERFEFVPPTIHLNKQSLSRHALLERRIKEILAFTGGMQEVVTYPWVEDRLLRAAAVEDGQTLRLSAPPAPDQGQLRPSLIPSLLGSVATNLRYFESFRIFEAGKVYLNGDFRPIDNSDERLPLERQRLGGALVGPDAEKLFLDAKGLIETVQRAAHIKSLTFSADPVAPWAERGARLGVQSGDESVGVLGVITNRAKRLADIKRSQVVLFELDIGMLQPLPSRENVFSALPEFPEVEIDLSFVVADSVDWSTIVEGTSSLHELIKEVVFVDQFRGKGIADGSKSITLRLRLGSSNRTLTADEAKEAASLVTETLKNRFGAHQRA